MYGELASVRGIVDLSPTDTLDKAQSFLTHLGYTVVRREGDSLTVERRSSDQYSPNLTVTVFPQTEGGVRITVRGNDQEGVRANQDAWLEWSESLPKKPEQETSQTARQQNATETVVASPSSPSTSEEATTVPEGAKRYCHNCGTQLPHEATNFCPGCGAAQPPRVNVAAGFPPPAPEAGRISTPYAPGVPPVPSQYQQRGPGVWSGVKIFFGGCIVLPVLLFLAFVACGVIAGSGGGN